MTPKKKAQRRRVKTNNYGPVKRNLYAPIRHNNLYGGPRRSAMSAIRGGQEASRHSGRTDGQKFALAQVNPFDDQCQGCRVPDRSTAQSTNFYTYDSFVCGTDATYGLTAHAFYPNVSITKVGATPSSASTWSWSAAFAGSSQSSKYSSVLTNYNVSRICAHGIRISCPMTVTSATGYVHVCLFTESVYSQSTWTLPTSVSQMTNSPNYGRYTLQQLIESPLIVVNKFLSENAFGYRDPNDDGHATNMSTIVANVNAAPFGWQTIMVCVEGAPNTSNPISVEVITHYEGQANNSSSASETLRTGESPSSSFMDAVSDGASRMSSAFFDNANSVRDRMDEARETFTTAAETLNVARNIGEALGGFARNVRPRLMP